MTVARAVVELDDVVVDYDAPAGTVRAVDHVSIAAMPGASLAIVGRSGSGKSSLVSVMSLMRAPSGGTVRFDGQEVTSATVRNGLRASEIAMVFQSFHLEPHLSVTENTMLHWYIAGSGSLREAQNRSRGVLERVGLGALGSRRVSALSGGERQRVAIARALFAGPRLLVADEPTGNLDEENAGVVCGLLTAAATEMGAAVVIVTHDLAVASKADRVVHIAHGRIDPASES